MIISFKAKRRNCCSWRGKH